jgi:hypothetical protein
MSWSTGKARMTYLRHTFTHFQHSQPTVSYLNGEFYWQVRYGDRADCNDYVCPPLILSSEKTENELTWSLGEYVEGPRALEGVQAQGQAAAAGRRRAQPAQPARGQGEALLDGLPRVRRRGPGRAVRHGRLQRREPPASGSLRGEARGEDAGTSPVFKIGGLLDGPVTVRTQSNVQDTWLLLDLKLTDADNGRAYGMKRQLGYSMVAGTQDGSQDDVGEFQSVPPGRYTLAVEGSSGHVGEVYPPPSFNGTVELYRSSAGWSNFWLLAGIPDPLADRRVARSSSFESRRWSESDYSGGSSSGDSDDDD